ncbi:hypothetical protein CA984_09990 [Streptosporangium minutum]|uniref:Uncharacterized protein n=1 Tax=Streptosporangium minutum TaxID=569862 RepID=A0A243RTM5_9ACTN|nr:hypothetical protein CA984_09990 [Streptosporangium minutum]
MDRIEEVASPYHDWVPQDEPVLSEGVVLKADADGVEIVRAGTVVGRIRGALWSTALAGHLAARPPRAAGDLARELSVPFSQLADALTTLERLGVVRTALAERCSWGSA